ncbi:MULTISPECIES: hypothetical protein [unclassified Anabaena]|uniref:hypothetical protein n=1 Tax=unclassified Anabaena TaxID=2619674 RepID=UPI0039C65B90
MKSTVYRNAVITACALGLLGLLVGFWDISVSFESVDPDISQLDEAPVSPVLDQTITSTNTTNPSATPTPPEELSQTHILADRQNSVADVKNQGNLRMSNRTNQPVRLALLARQSQAKNADNKHINYDVPAHWDFDPQEGSEKGLKLSLPNGNLKLEPGDIIIAFAQDGSRRYWGPYVVGETSLPEWNQQNQEWLLVLNP